MPGIVDDNPTTDDRLGFNSIADILRRVIHDTRRRPVTIGIFGEWGSGKTTLMQMVRSRLQKDGIKTVWFNAWKYDAKEVIWNALIQEIFYTIQRDPEIQRRPDAKVYLEHVADFAGKLAIYAAKVATRLVPGGIIKEEDVDTVIEAFRPPSANDELFEFINRFESVFDKLVQDYVGSEGYLVVFIDDLDRCLPDSAISVMEALKLYLDRSNCVFVFGAESSIIEEGINQRYKNNPRLSGKDYLDKVVQLPFMVPRIEAENALSLLDDHDATVSYKDDAEIRNLIAIGTQGNPRRIKRFINSFWILSAIAGELSIAQRRQLAKILLIQMRFPMLYYALSQDHNLLERMMNTLKERGPARREIIEASPQAVKDLYGDSTLLDFLSRTRDISSDGDQIARWVMLTKGQATSVIGASAEHADLSKLAERAEGINSPVRLSPYLITLLCIQRIVKYAGSRALKMRLIHYVCPAHI